jgi:hypothetical protein
MVNATDIIASLRSTHDEYQSKQTGSSAAPPPLSAPANNDRNDRNNQNPIPFQILPDTPFIPGECFFNVMGRYRQTTAEDERAEFVEHLRTLSWNQQQQLMLVSPLQGARRWDEWLRLIAQRTTYVDNGIIAQYIMWRRIRVRVHQTNAMFVLGPDDPQWPMYDAFYDPAAQHYMMARVLPAVDDAPIVAPPAIVAPPPTAVPNAANATAPPPAENTGSNFADRNFMDQLAKSTMQSVREEKREAKKMTQRDLQVQEIRRSYLEQLLKGQQPTVPIPDIMKKGRELATERARVSKQNEGLSLAYKDFEHLKALQRDASIAPLPRTTMPPSTTTPPAVASTVPPAQVQRPSHVPAAIPTPTLPPPIDERSWTPSNEKKKRKKKKRKEAAVGVEPTAAEKSRETVPEKKKLKVVLPAPAVPAQPSSPADVDRVSGLIANLNTPLRTALLSKLSGGPSVTPVVPLELVPGAPKNDTAPPPGSQPQPKKKPSPRRNNSPNPVEANSDDSDDLGELCPICLTRSKDVIWIQCDDCAEWLHGRCVRRFGDEPDHFDDHEQYRCPKCRQRDNLEPKGKRHRYQDP